MSKVYIIGAKRTPIAQRGGALAAVRPEIFAAVCARELLASSSVAAAELDGIIAGNAVGTGGNITRLTALTAGLPEKVPALTVDMQCASGAAAISLAYAKIAAGQGEVYLAGGMESSSLQPLRTYATADPRCALEEGGTGSYYTAQFAPGDLRPDTMLRGAERVMEVEHVSAAELNEWVLRSHHRAAAARERGLLDGYVVPITSDAIARYTCGDNLTNSEPNGDAIDCRADEGIRANMSERLLRRLPPKLGPGTLLNAGNACMINDGAAFVLLASERYVREHALTPLAEIVGTCALGGAPDESPRGAQRTAERLLEREGYAMADMAAIEFNEAFAIIDVLFARKYPALTERYNRLGGALAYGHPYAASGAILACHLLASLRVAGGGLGLLSIAGAGGLGEAILVNAPA